VHHLSSLDPELYKNLMFVKTYEGDVTDLSLSFVVTDDLNDSVEVELVAGGADIPVTNKNKLQYIHLVADRRLKYVQCCHKQVRIHKFDCPEPR
jgi:ubiquitin-protein ligase E3 C